MHLGQRETLQVKRPQPETAESRLLRSPHPQKQSSWNVMAHDDAREGKWRGNWQMQWVASILHTTTEHGVSSITTADAHTSAAQQSTDLTPPTGRFKWTRQFGRKTKSGFCVCAITFQTQSKSLYHGVSVVCWGSQNLNIGIASFTQLLLPLYLEFTYWLCC